MPVPKTSQEIAEQIPAKSMTWIQKLFKGKAGGLYDPVSKTIYIRDNLNPVEEHAYKIHEFTHHVMQDVDDQTAHQVKKDLRLILGDNADNVIDYVKRNYSEREFNRELLARFSELNSWQISFPTTKTGMLLNRKFSDALGWRKTPTQLIDELKNSLDKVNESNYRGLGKTIADIFSKNIINKISQGLRQTYIKTKNIISNEQGIIPVFDVQDEQIVDTYVKGVQLWDAYAGLDRDMTNKVNLIISNSFEGNVFNPDKARKLLLRDVPKLAKFRVNRILRTEFGNIQNISAEQTYRQIDPKGEGRYEWLSTPDFRRTGICKTITARTRGGVTMEELKQIIREEADPKTYTADRPFTPHLNCRSRMIKIR